MDVSIIGNHGMKAGCTYPSQTVFSEDHTPPQGPAPPRSLTTTVRLQSEGAGVGYALGSERVARASSTPWLEQHSSPAIPSQAAPSTPAHVLTQRVWRSVISQPHHPPCGLRIQTDTRLTWRPSRSNAAVLTVVHAGTIWHEASKFLGGVYQGPEI